ncbi:hypothetical protein XELAEV_18030031mg [Xenopus laevis]|uniref:Uncharacterized protein n=1 Tax=Xenopus laevis TaxID=8355 RepID=A0A974CUE8_XENLA|nr:hypothetical protein XELAEV_18030031mg [Xenopus laevis]
MVNRPTDMMSKYHGPVSMEQTGRDYIMECLIRRWELQFLYNKLWLLVDSGNCSFKLQMQYGDFFIYSSVVPECVAVDISCTPPMQALIGKQK